MNSCTDQQIRVAYEDNGMSPEDISNDLGFQVEAVKAKLMQVSSKYRQDCGKEPVEEDDLNFSNDELRLVNREILNLALGSDDEHLRFKALTYVRDDKKGRKDVVKTMAGNTFNILQFNEMLGRARVGAEKFKQQITNGHAVNGQLIEA